MMTNGLLAAFKTEMASVIAPWGATLTGGAGQQDTTLQEKDTSLNFNMSGITGVILSRNNSIFIKK